MLYIAVGVVINLNIYSIIDSLENNGIDSGISSLAIQHMILH